VPALDSSSNRDEPAAAVPRIDPESNLGMEAAAPRGPQQVRDRTDRARVRGDGPTGHDGTDRDGADKYCARP
jgi:hypothetical protein